jgi:hypothetical protein
MKMRKLGHQGLVVSELGLGCMGMSEFYGDSNEQEAIARKGSAPFGASPRFIMLSTSVSTCLIPLICTVRLLTSS